MEFVDIVLLGVLALAVITLITMVTNLLVLVPYVPTSHRVVRRMIELAKIQAGETVYDLGCGDARILTTAKRQYPDIRAIGYEVSLGVWMLAKLRVFLSRLPVTVHMRDYRGAHFGDANVVFLYLFPEVMKPLRKKLDEELKPGTRVLSHGFPFPDKEPVHMERVALPSWHMMKPPREKGPRVFVYEW